MKSLLTKTLLAALPLMGILLTAPPAALAKHHQHCWDGEDRYSYDHPYYEDDYYDRGDPYDRYGYGARPYDGDPYAYGGRPYYGDPYAYGSRPYSGGGPSADPYALGPSALLPSLLGLLLPGY